MPETDVNEPTAATRFTRVVCGVDGSREAIEAVRQASRLGDASATITLVAAIDPFAELWDTGPFRTLETLQRIEDRASARLARARAAIESPAAVDARIVEAAPAAALVELAAAGPERLLAVGAKRQSRLSGLLLGSVATRVLHDAPCSVLLARPPADPEAFPAAVVVGVDGSPQSAAAFAVASSLAERLAVELRPLVALGGTGADLEAVQQIVGERFFATDRRAPADALAAAEADLVVVGCRGLHGIAALGSVSERIAHRTSGSVLVVKAT